MKEELVVGTIVRTVTTNIVGVVVDAPTELYEYARVLLVGHELANSYYPDSLEIVASPPERLPEGISRNRTIFNHSTDTYTYRLTSGTSFHTISNRQNRPLTSEALFAFAELLLMEEKGELA